MLYDYKTQVKLNNIVLGMLKRSGLQLLWMCLTIKNLLNIVGVLKITYGNI